MSNTSRASRYRERIKGDPDKAQAWRNKAAIRMRKKRSVAQHDQPVAQQSVAQQRQITPEERALLLAAFDEPEQEDPLARIHREWKAECEALGYDVDANREAARLLMPQLVITEKPEHAFGLS